MVKEKVRGLVRGEDRGPQPPLPEPRCSARADDADLCRTG